MVARYYFLPLALQLFRVNVTDFGVKRYNFWDYPTFGRKIIPKIIPNCKDTEFLTEKLLFSVVFSLRHPKNGKTVAKVVTFRPKSSNAY